MRPYVNVTAGAAGLASLHFTLWGTADEAVWVAVYSALAMNSPET